MKIIKVSLIWYTYSGRDSTQLWDTAPASRSFLSIIGSYTWRCLDLYVSVCTDDCSSSSHGVIERLDISVTGRLYFSDIFSDEFLRWPPVCSSASAMIHPTDTSTLFSQGQHSSSAEYQLSNWDLVNRSDTHSTRMQITFADICMMRYELDKGSTPLLKYRRIDTYLCQVRTQYSCSLFKCFRLVIPSSYQTKSSECACGWATVSYHCGWLCDPSVTKNSILSIIFYFI